MSVLPVVVPQFKGAAPSFLLDDYGANCVGAWSVTRKLKTGITYPLRASWNGGANAQDIGFDGSNETDTAALLSAVGSGTARAELYDQSGNGRNLTNTASFSARPRIVNSGVLDTFGGFPALRFSNFEFLRYDNWASLTGLSGNPNYSVFAVYSIAAAANGHLFGWGDNAVSLGCTGIYNDASFNLFHFSGGNFKSISASSTSTLYALDIVKTAGAINTTSSIFRNGSDVTVAGGSTSTPNIVSTNFPLRMGAWASGTDYLFSGHCLELIIYAADKSSDRAAIRSEIMSFYGL